MEKQQYHFVSMAEAKKLKKGDIIFIGLRNGTSLTYQKTVVLPIIIDGYHRWMAARYLYELGSLHKIHCLYAGREDVLDYLKGKLDTMPQEEIA